MSRILYVCSFCADNNPEMCGHYDRTDLAVMPDGRWLCESCFDEERPAPNDDEECAPSFVEMPRPPEYGPKEAA